MRSTTPTTGACACAPYVSLIFVGGNFPDCQDDHESNENYTHENYLPYGIKSGPCTGPLIKPWRMREGYGSRFVCLCMCLSVTELAATFLDYTLRFRCH